ncbi:MAG: entericidin [Duncaniella sp.]|nr:entericidin [Duncaniella sp.]
MKKLVLVAAVAFSASLFSCGSSDKAAENNDTVAVEETVVEEVVAVDSVAAPADSVAADSVAAPVAE